MARRPSVPREVVTRVGSAMEIDELARWWVERHEVLGTSPRDLWTKGQQERVLNFIDAASGKFCTP